jgi:hypothetical protein
VTLATNAINLTNANIGDGRQWAYIPQDASWSKLKKTANQTVNNAVVTWAADLGNTALNNSNQGFIVPCNGLWTVKFSTRWTVVAGLTGLIDILNLNGVEAERDSQSTNGFSGVISGASAKVSLDKFPLSTGDLLTCQGFQFGASTAQVDTGSWAVLAWEGPSNVGPAMAQLF